MKREFFKLKVAEVAIKGRIDKASILLFLTSAK
jgi:hypothetical protein